MVPTAEAPSQPPRLRNIDLGRNPIADAQREYEVLTEFFETRTREWEEAVKLNNAMAADVDAKNREIDRLATQVREQEERIRLLQGFSVALVTRLDTVSEIIAIAKREAWEQAGKLGLSTATADDQIVEPTTLVPADDLSSLERLGGC